MRTGFQYRHLSGGALKDGSRMVRVSGADEPVTDTPEDAAIGGEEDVAGLRDIVAWLSLGRSVDVVRRIKNITPETNRRAWLIHVGWRPGTIPHQRQHHHSAHLLPLPW